MHYGLKAVSFKGETVKDLAVQINDFFKPLTLPMAKARGF
jgi:hypothetical protein